MQIRVDNSRCTGHAQCAAVEPDLFPMDDLGYSALEPREVSRDLVSRMRTGVAACPEGALVLDENA